jgi:adenine-specific DNA-methyltransferase
MFYPFFITNGGSRIHSIGNALPAQADRDSVIPPTGTFAAWPIRQDGTEGRWRLGPESARKAWQQGYIKIGSQKGEMTPVYYLTVGEQQKIADGIYEVLGQAEDGSVITSILESDSRRIVPSTQWHISSHDSTQYGSRLLLKFLGEKRFPFPKSLYAVEDSLRFFVENKPEAVVLDFFAGSGTTAHAVMRLNRQDGGKRQSISVTNNEVSADEQESLTRAGLRAGDAEWESQGVCDYVTKPRIMAAVAGITPSGKPIEGDYKFTDEFPMAEGFEENVEFFTMTYEAPRRVAHNRAFESIAPLLWLRAGAQGRRIDTVADDFGIADTYGILFDLDASGKFVQALHKAESARVAFIVTDDERGYQMVSAELPAHVESVQLYESYLINFAINTARELPGNAVHAEGLPKRRCGWRAAESCRCSG